MLHMYHTLCVQACHAIGHQMKCVFSTPWCLAGHLQPPSALAGPAAWDTAMAYPLWLSSLADDLLLHGLPLGQNQEGRITQPVQWGDQGSHGQEQQQQLERAAGGLWQWGQCSAPPSAEDAAEDREPKGEVGGEQGWQGLWIVHTSASTTHFYQVGHSQCFVPKLVLCCAVLR